jgi:two-component system response regulator HydG
MATILAIDDSISALRAVDEILTGAGYQVRCCTDGKEALALLKEEAFDLILTDIYMPDEDGLAVIRARRRICPAVPVVAMSGITGLGNMLAAARHMGACETLQKPFSENDLLRAIARALGIRRETEISE